MALQVCPAYRQDVIGMEEGNDELEEGEACEPNDSTDLSFPHLELKLAEVLGDARKDFEGGIYAEKLGSKFGGYGTFLPTVPAAPPPPPPASGRRSPLCTQNSPKAVKRENGIFQSKTEDVKKPFTLRIKMGPDVRAKNAAIYNKLGFSSPSISEDEEDEEEISSPESPDRSPASMIQYILSHRPPPLLSPLPDLIQKEKPTLKAAKASERKLGKREVSVDDSAKGDAEHTKQSKAGRLQEDVNRTGVEAGKVLSKKENRQGVKAQLEEASSEKRKLKDSLESESLKKRHRSNSSTGSIETNASKEGKTQRKQPSVVLPEEKKKAKFKAEVPESGFTKARVTKVVKPQPPLLQQPPPLQQPAASLIPDAVVAPPAVIKENWVECEECHQWRLLPPTMDPPSSADTWLCSMSTWLPPGMNNCRFSEEETTNALYASLGISQCPVPVDPAPPPLPLALPAAEPKLAQTKKASDGKLGRTTLKKRDKPPKQQLVTEDVNEEKTKKKKKRPSPEEPPVAKKIKSEEGLQRGKPVHAEVPYEMDEDGERIRNVKTVKKEEDKKEKPEEREERRRPVEDLPGKPSKYLRVEKNFKAKAVPGKASARAKLNIDGTEQKRKKNLSPPSPCDSVDAFRTRAHDSAEGLNFVDREVRKSTYDGENHCRSLELQGGDPVEHETYGTKHFKEWQEDSSWDEADKKQRTFDRDDRYRDRNDEKDKDLDSKWEKREDRHREEKSSRKSIRRVEGGEPEKVRLKHSDALKGEHEEGKVGKDNTDDSGRKGAVECLEGKEIIDRKDASSLASNAIKAAKNLKHTADRLKDETATDIYLQAALKFLQGAALMECVTLYNDTAVLFKYCAGQYERANDMPGAVLAYKCAAVARFRLLMVKNASMSRDRADLQAALLWAPAANQAAPATGESPSSSSASDLDNLNSQVIPVEKIFSNPGKGAVSPVVQGSESVPAALQPTLDRFVRNTADVFDAFDVWNKADSVLAAVVTAKVLSSDKLAALEKVGSIGFSDVEALVRLVNQALEALGR